jgi:hypothetical protein
VGFAAGFSGIGGSWTTTASAAAACGWTAGEALGEGGGEEGAEGTAEGTEDGGAGDGGVGAAAAAVDGFASGSIGVVCRTTGSGSRGAAASLARAWMWSTARVVTMPKAKVVRQSPMSTFLETTILSVAAASVENLDERARGGIRSVSRLAGIATGIPSSGATDTGVSGGVTLRLTLNFRLPTDRNPPSGDCSTKRLPFAVDHMPETVKTLCQSSRSFVKRAAADLQVHTVQTSRCTDLSGSRPNQGKIWRENRSAQAKKRAITSQAAREAAR